MLSSTGVNVAGTLNVTGNANVDNLGTNTAIITTGNITTINSGLLQSGNSNITLTANSNVTIYVAGNANAILTATSTGIVANGTMAVSGNISAPFFIGNVQGNISGNLVVPGSNTAVIFNYSGNANASDAFKFDYVANVLTVIGNIVSSGAGNVFSGNGSSLTALNASNVSSGTLAQARLANDSVTLGNTALTLGNTVTTVAGLTSVTSTTFTSNVAVGTAPFVVTSTTQVANLHVATAGLATYASTANAVAGANVSGAVSYATTANAVAGGNVSGTVANATYAVSAGTAGTVTTAAQGNITSVGTLTTLTVANAGTSALTVGASGGASYTTLAVRSGTGYNSTIIFESQKIAGGDNKYAYLIQRGQTGNNFNGHIIVNVATGNGTYLDVAYFNPAGVTITGAITTNAITTGSNVTAGTITGDWTLTAGSKLNATYADLAEYYEADAAYEPGTVLEFGGDKEVTIAEDSTIKVAGVVSTNPAYIMNSLCLGTHTVAIALQGRVPTKVRGKIRKGDMLISGGNGFARPAKTSPMMGTVIGKALENFDGEGVIEVAISRM